MSPQAQVEKQIQDDYDKFIYSVYNGKISVPDNIVELLKIAVMGLPPQFHGVHMNKIKVIISKKPSELNNGELADVIKLIFNCPLEKLYEDFEEAVEGHLKLEKFVLSYNNYVNEFQENLKMKKANLINLSGIRNNGLKIIN